MNAIHESNGQLLVNSLPKVFLVRSFRPFVPPAADGSDIPFICNGAWRSLDAMPHPKVTRAAGEARGAGESATAAAVTPKGSSGY